MDYRTYLAIYPAALDGIGGRGKFSHTPPGMAGDRRRGPGREEKSRIIWQRSGKDIYPANEIISRCYYNRNETETALDGKLEQTASGYYPSRIDRI